METPESETPGDREFWAFVERAAKEVATWPAWKRGWYAAWRREHLKPAEDGGYKCTS